VQFCEKDLFGFHKRIFIYNIGARFAV
jgi:hypothetical protein